MTAYLCKMFNIDPNGTINCDGVNCPTIIDHVGSYSLGLGSGHADIQHWSRKYGVTMDTVRKDVAAILAADKSGSSTSTTPTTPTGTASTESDAQAIWNRLYSAIGNKYGVAGVMGNMYAESGLKSDNLQNTYEKSLGYTDTQYTKAVDNGSYTNFVKDSAGYGLVQWTYWTLKQGLLNYAKSKGVSIGDWKMQVDFFIKEMKEEYKSVWTVLTSAKTVREASDAVLLKFERPADQSESVQKKRAGYGEDYLKKCGGSSNMTTVIYRVRKTWADSKSQKGSYKVLANAKKCADKNPGYSVFDGNGKRVYPAETTTPNSFKSYLVEVKAIDLNYRKGPGTNYDSYGFIKPGVYTIVDEQNGLGLLKAYAEKRNGWISLNYTTKV